MIISVVNLGKLLTLKLAAGSLTLHFRISTSKEKQAGGEKSGWKGMGGVVFVRWNYEYMKRKLIDQKMTSNFSLYYRCFSVFCHVSNVWIISTVRGTEHGKTHIQACAEIEGLGKLIPFQSFFLTCALAVTVS